MAEKVVAGPVSSANGVREAVCIHTKKIYSSCRDKDCIEDLRFYPTATAQSVLSAAQNIRGGSAELLYTFVDVEPVNFNRGYYTVDMRFFYRIILQAMSGGTRYTARPYGESAHRSGRGHRSYPAVRPLCRQLQLPLRLRPRHAHGRSHRHSRGV